MIQTIYYIAKADFLQRVRSYSFLVTLGVCLWISYSFIPGRDADYTTVALGDYTFVYNSAAIGTMMAIVSGLMLSLFGFYLINNSIHRDFHTGVGQILATTQVTKFQYLTGKWLSNFLVLTSIISIISLMSIFLFYTKGEADNLEIIPLLLPFVFICLPSFAFISSLAVLGEVFVRINKGVINILYFVFWVTMLVNSIQFAEEQADNKFLAAASDFIGMAVIFSDAEKTLYAQTDEKEKDLGWNIGMTYRNETKGNKIKKFDWEGYPWDIETILGRMIWFVISLLMIGFASIFFRRFDPSGLNISFLTKKQKVIQQEEVAEKPLIPFALLPKATIAFNLPALIKAELKIMLWGNSRWWLLVVAGLWIATIFTPLQVAHQFLLPILFVWFVLIWSKMGTREMMYETNQYLFSAASPLSRQVPAQLLAGISIGVLISLPLIVRQSVALDFMAVYGIIAAIIFVPSFAFCLGIWTGGSKFFEVFFVILFYIFLNNAPFADFTGATAAAQNSGYTHIYLMVGFTAIVLSFVGRRRQLYI